MLQRKQTFWTFLAIACAALSFKFPFFSGTRLATSQTSTGIHQYLTNADTAWILLVTSLIIIGGFFSIISFKNRRRQAWVTIGLIALSLLNIVLLYLDSHNNFLDGVFSLTAILNLAIPILCILAFRGIIRDEKLVKSADRLR